MTHRTADRDPMPWRRWDGSQPLTPEELHAMDEPVTGSGIDLRASALGA